MPGTNVMHQALTAMPPSGLPPPAGLPPPPGLPRAATAPPHADAAWLYFAELIHRINNEYASVIAFASLAATRTSSPEARDVLHQMINRLCGYAGAHRLLQPPLADEPADLADHLGALCDAMRSAGLRQRGIVLTLSPEQPARLRSTRCWRVGLIVAELITNASRHALARRGGTIEIVLSGAPGWIECRVRDNGTASSDARPGRGTRLVDALAAELDAVVERRFEPRGTTVTLLIPSDS